MAKNKIQRIDQEIAKVREKIAEAENLEIVQMVRALRMTPAQLNAMLSGSAVPGMAAASADYTEQEEISHEE